jgi:hypothetical protein
MKPIALDAAGGDAMPQAAVGGGARRRRAGIPVVLSATKPPSAPNWALKALTCPSTTRPTPSAWKTTPPTCAAAGSRR